MKNLHFKLWNFDRLHEEDMKDQIFQMFSDKKLDGAKEFGDRRRNFWQSFVYLFNLVLQIRNSTATQYRRDDQGNITEVINGVDFIASPVRPFFVTDGDEYTEGRVNLAGLEDKFIGTSASKELFKKEFNGDANGAYNIARKGIMILKNIGNNLENPDLFISRKDWDEFAQSS